MKDYSKVWKELGPSTWSSILAETKSSSITSSGSTVKATCPYPEHSDSTPSFYIRTDRGFSKCFGCGRFCSNPVQFVAAIKGITEAQAFLELRAKGANLPLALGKKIQEREKKLAVNGEIAYIANTSLSQAAANKEDPKWEFAQKALEFLESRGIPLDSSLISQLPIGVLPPFKIIEDDPNLHNKASMMEFFKGWLQDKYSSYVGALVFFYYTSPTELTGFRIRFEFLSPRWKEKKYLAIGPKNDDTELGYFGLANFSAKIGGSKLDKKPWAASTAFVVEGEFDLLTPLVKYYTVEGLCLDPIICTQGSLVSNLDDLEKLGIERLYLCLDNYHRDRGGLLRLKEVMASTKLQCFVFNWELDAKDPDEAVVKLGWETVKDALFSETNGVRDNFTSGLMWCVEQAKEAVEGKGPDDLRSSLADVAAIGRCLSNPLDNRAFVSFLAEETGISKSLITQAILGREETEMGFIYRITLELTSIYEFVGIETDNQKTNVAIWNKKHRKLRSIEITRGFSELIQSITTELGALIRWAEETLGLPEFVVYTGVGEKRVENSILKQTSTIAEYIKVALAEILAGTPPLGSLKKLAQGAHYINVGGNDPSSKVYKWALVNGDKAYISSPLDGGEITWEEYSEPILGKAYFELDRRYEWSQEITTVADLNSANTSEEELARVWNLIYSMLVDGWVIEEGNPGMEYLTNAFFVNTVNTCVGRHLYTIINGERNTGKSTLAELLCSSDYDYRLLECVHTSDNYTSAGVRNAMDARAGGYLCDEFEVSAKDKGKAKKVTEILSNQRGLVSKPEHKVQHGAPGGKQKTYTLKYQVWACAIESLRDPADISRFVRLKTKKVEGKIPPKKVLADKYGIRTIAECRRFLSLSVYRHTPAFLANIEKLKNDYHGGVDDAVSPWLQELMQITNGPVPGRLLEAAIITAAMGMLAGRDPHAYIRSFIISQRSSISIITDSVESRDLFNDILSCSVKYQEIGNVTGRVTIRHLLSDPTNRERIGSLDVGLSYASFADKRLAATMGAKHYLVIEWNTLLMNLLRPNKPGEYGRYETAQKLKARLSTDPNVLEWSDTVRKRIGGKKRHLKVGVKQSDITVYDLTSIIEDWEKDD